MLNIPSLRFPKRKATRETRSPHRASSQRVAGINGPLSTWTRLQHDRMWITGLWRSPSSLSPSFFLFLTLSLTSTASVCLLRSPTLLLAIFYSFSLSLGILPCRSPFFPSHRFSVTLTLCLLSTPPALYLSICLSISPSLPFSLFSLSLLFSTVSQIQRQRLSERPGCHLRCILIQTLHSVLPAPLQTQYGDRIRWGPQLSSFKELKMVDGIGVVIGGQFGWGGDG